MTTFLIIYLICGLLAAFYGYGTTFAYFQRKYYIIAQEMYRHDRVFAIGMAFIFLMFPFAVIIPIFFSGFNQYGFKLK